MDDIERAEVIRLIEKRSGLLALLVDGTGDKRNLAEELDVSRRTVDRALNDLEDAGLVTVKSGTYEPTRRGRLGYRAYARFEATLAGIEQAEDLFDALPEDLPLDHRIFLDAEVHRADRYEPRRPVEALADHLRSAEVLCGVASWLSPGQVHLLHEHVREGGLSVAVTVDPGFRREAGNERLVEMSESDRCAIETRRDLPDCGVLLIDEAELCLCFHDGIGELAGTLFNGAGPAVRWGRNLVETLASWTSIDAAPGRPAKSST